jgi:PAS domain S-box-containing protein
MLILKSQIETTPAFMEAVLCLPFDQKFLIGKRVHTACLYIDTEFHPHHRSVLPPPGRIDEYPCEPSPSRLGTLAVSTFVPASNRRILFMCRAIILLVAVCFHSSVGIALDPSRRISQYQHTAWRSQDGFVTVAQMTQTTDGYLWLTTPDGLFRFDGVQLVPFAPKGLNIPTRRFTSLLGSRDGSLWIATSSGLSRLKDGKLLEYSDSGKRISYGVILEDSAGTIWVTRYHLPSGEGPLCRVEGDKLHCFGEADGVPRIQYALGLTEDKVGNLWFGGPVLSQWRPGSAGTTYMNYLETLENHGEGVIDVAATPDGTIWATVDGLGPRMGVRCFSGGKWAPYIVHGFDGTKIRSHALFVDKDNSLWVGTEDDGVYRLHDGIADHYGTADGLSGDSVGLFYEDHEGDLWVMTDGGIDKFHDTPVVTYSAHVGLTASEVSSVLALHDGAVWVGNEGGADIIARDKFSHLSSLTHFQDVKSLFQDDSGAVWLGTTGGLVRYEAGHIEEIKSSQGPKLDRMVDSITEDTGHNIWALTHNRQLFLISDRTARKVLELTSDAGNMGFMTPDQDGGLWIAAVNGTLTYYQNGVAQTITSLKTRYGDSLRVHAIAVSSDNTLLTSTNKGLLAWNGHGWSVLGVKNGLPCDDIFTAIEDNHGTLWLSTRCGYASLRRSELDRWGKDITSKLHVDVFDRFDGARPGTSANPTQPSSTKSPDGRLWFANQVAVQMIDPNQLYRNPVPPPVHIERLVADHKDYELGNKVGLPALTRDVEIDYSALSVAVPQKVLIRYRLENRDNSWQDAGTRRQAFYTNLPPGKYRFRVIACNNSGTWNEEGAMLDFAIAPAYYQTNWFRALWAAAFLALLCVAYQVRVRQLRSEEQKFREAVETMPALAFIARSDGQRTFVNSRWIEYTGLTEKQALGWGWQVAVHPNDLSRALTTWQESQASGNTLEYEARILRSADGDYRWFQTRAVPVRDKRGKIVKWYGVINDIEDRKRVEQLQADLAHVNRVSTMGELTASLAHEIKQPIGAAVTNAEACARLLDRDQPDVLEARTAALEMVKDAGRAAHIIDRVRSLYRKGSSQMDSVDVSELTGEMLLILHNEAHRHSVNIVTYVAEGLPKVMADRVQLQQVLMNLMLNGIQAMEDAGGVLTIKAQLRQDVQVQISVSDTGVGLPDDKAEHIFDAFFTTKPEGSGMGLAISRSIIESHGGRVWASANSGKGATFHFTLPLAPHFMPR